MDISTAQSDLRNSYVNGGPGAIMSGMIWWIAAIASSKSGIQTGFLVLFFGGMLIFPTANMIVRVVFRRPAPLKENPGGLIVVETVFPMMAGFLAAWLIMPYRPEFVFALSAIAVGAHYFGFRTAYGDKIYWVLAAVLCLVGSGAIFANMPGPNAVPYVIAGIEVIFGIWLTWKGMRDL